MKKIKHDFSARQEKEGRKGRREGERVQKSGNGFLSPDSRFLWLVQF